MKRVSVVELENNLLIKVEHQVKGLIAGVSVFLIKEDGMVQEITPGVLDKAEEEKVVSRDYDRVATQEEIELTHQILESRDQYVLERVIRTNEALGGIRLVRLIEMGGRYFAYTMHETLRFARIAEVVLTPDELPIDFNEVPLEYLPLLAENISEVLMQNDNKKGVTLQFGEGLFLRLKRFLNNIYSTVIVLDGQGSEGKLKTSMAFVLAKRDEKWVHVQEGKGDFQNEKLEVEMEKALNHVFNELALSAGVR